jgi:metal-sulfur cluster biosynthetic enzyme
MVNNELPAFYSSIDPTIVNIREGLREVIDPEIGLNVIELGLIRDLEIIDGTKLDVTMILTTPFCPYGPAMVEMVRKTATERSGLETTVNIGLEMWSPDLMEDGAGGDWGLF